MSWTRQGCPYVQKADRAEGVAWIFDIAEVLRWREALVANAASGEAPVNLIEAQARKMAAEAALAEIKLAKLRGEVVSVRDTEKTWSAFVGNFRAKVMTLPQRLAPVLAGQRDERVITKLLQDEFHQALDELSRTAIDADTLLDDA